MSEVITIGVDLAKNVFRVHGVDAEGSVIVRRQLGRGQVLPFFKKRPSTHGLRVLSVWKGPKEAGIGGVGRKPDRGRHESLPSHAGPPPEPAPLQPALGPRARFA